MKTLKIIIFLFATANITNLKAQKTFESFIDGMKNSKKHTGSSTLDFDSGKYIYPNYDIYNGPSIESFSFSFGLKEIPIKAHFMGKVVNTKFSSTSGDIILEKYDVNPKIVTILIRSNYGGYPEHLSLVNFKKENGKYIPVADLSAGRGGGGEEESFYFNTIKNWVIYNYSNDGGYALGVAYKIDNAGNFIKVHRQEFNELTFQDIFRYKGVYVYPRLETYIYQVSRIGIKESNNDKVLVDNLYNIFRKLDDDTIKRLVNYYGGNIRSLSIAQIRSAVGAQDSSESMYYDIVAPFDVWLEGKIKEHLLKTYKVVEFDNN